MCGAEDWRRRHSDMYGQDVVEPLDESHRVKVETEETANLTRNMPPAQPSTYLVNQDRLELAPNCTFWTTNKLHVTQVCASQTQKEQALVTLFTTMHDSTRNHYLYKNVIHLHSALKPKVQPMLFVSSPVVEKNLVRDACAEGWHVLIAPSCNKHQLPVLRDMFLAAQKVQRSHFYAYANGDIVFEDSLIKTLEYLLSKTPHFSQALFVGSRTNVKVRVRHVFRVKEEESRRIRSRERRSLPWVLKNSFCQIERGAITCFPYDVPSACRLPPHQVPLWKERHVIETLFSRVWHIGHDVIRVLSHHLRSCWVSHRAHEGGAGRERAKGARAPWTSHSQLPFALLVVTRLCLCFYFRV